MLVINLVVTELLLAALGIPVGYRIQNTEYRVQNTEYSIQNTEYRIQNPIYRIQNTEYRIQNTEYRIQNTGEHVCGGPTWLDLRAHPLCGHWLRGHFDRCQGWDWWADALVGVIKSVVM